MLCQDLTSAFCSAFGEGYLFKPDFSIRGGIMIADYPGRGNLLLPSGPFKSIRFDQSHMLQHQGKYDFNRFDDWINNHTPLFDPDEIMTEHKKSGYKSKIVFRTSNRTHSGAPAWNIKELRIVYPLMRKYGFAIQ